MSKKEMTPEQITRNEKIKHWFLLLFFPSVLMLAKDKEDKSGYILSAIVGAALIIFFISLIITFRANFICILCWIAVNVWCWISMWMDRDQ